MKTRKMKWVPAEQGGKKTAYRYIVPVSFNTPAPAKEKPVAKAVTAAPTDGIYDVVDVRPQFAGCENSTDTIDCTFRKMLAHIKSNMQYPEDAIKHSVHGQVMVEFVVGEDGMVKNVSLVQGIGAGCDQEAMRLVSSMPAFTPGTLAGKAVPVRMKLPIYFQLPKKEE
jgi:protein TonB